MKSRLVMQYIPVVITQRVEVLDTLQKRGSALRTAGYARRTRAACGANDRSAAQRSEGATEIYVRERGP